MAYPRYEVVFQPAGGVPVTIDGSHTFEMTIGGSNVTVMVTHQSEDDVFPQLVMQFSPAPPQP